QAVAPLPQNARIKIFAKVNFYTGNGSLSLNAREIHHVGLGELLARLEMLKRVLAAEGLFAASRKKPLPFLPRRVGLICGRNSAAEKDVVENAKRRWPAVQFEIREVAVQGSSAVSEVSNALRELEAIDDVDVIIITRGGGSFEDLLPFSDEGLVRLVATCDTPIVSAIGHEQDTPLLDLVADLRASTPTDAAKRVVPDIQEEISGIKELSMRLHRGAQRRVETEERLIANLGSRPVMRDPMLIITPEIESLVRDRASLKRSLLHRLTVEGKEVAGFVSQLRALSPFAVLERGYSVALHQDGRIIKDASELDLGDLLAVRFAKGAVTASVTETTADISLSKQE
ncbi:MAG: exodeoxyribonuclease VII large subunit, partial [Candidatus Nanopelagicaceae bacterium]